MIDHDYHDLAKTLASEGVNNQEVLDAIARTPRHEFMPENMREHAEENRALPIGAGQTISQPFVVARMTETLLENGPINKVLEIGTGSGYQAAILSQVCTEVYTIERIRSLYEQSSRLFKYLNNNNIHTRWTDGNLGWPEQAPFDAIIVTAATSDVPPALFAQMALDSRMIIPIGDATYQTLQLITRTQHGHQIRHLDTVVFVPLRKGVE